MGPPSSMRIPFSFTNHHVAESVLIIIRLMSILLTSSFMGSSKGEAATSSPTNSDTRPPFHPFTKPVNYDPKEIEKHSYNSTIPKVIHFTVPTKKDLDYEYYSKINGCIGRNEDHMVIVYDHEDMHLFVSIHFPKLLLYYEQLASNIMRSDLFRYLALYKHGGIYMDSDIDCMKPCSEWLNILERNRLQHLNQLVDINTTTTTITSKDDVMVNQHRLSATSVRLIVGVEIDNRKLKDGSGEDRFQFATWTIATAPKHAALMNTISKIISAIKHPAPNKNAVVYLTGPAVFTAGVLEIVYNLHGLEYNRHGVNLITTVGSIDDNLKQDGYDLVDDILMLSINHFGANQRGGTQDRNHREVLVWHTFAGRWKKARKPVKDMTWIEYLDTLVHGNIANPQ